MMKHLLLPLLAMSVTLAAAGAAQAQNGPPASIQVNFGSAPHWTTVEGTRVREISVAERPAYDMFRYGGQYYVYDHDRWYSSRRGNGEFRVIDERYVPREFARVPREHWHNYPSHWTEPNNGHHGGKHGHRMGHGH